MVGIVHYLPCRSPFQGRLFVQGSPLEGAPTDWDSDTYKGRWLWHQDLSREGLPQDPRCSEKGIQ